MWSLFPESQGAKKATAWRVEEFLGLDTPPTAAAPADWKTIVDDRADAAVVVLDDANLGFRSHRELWPLALSTKGKRPWVVLKIARPVGEGALWEHLVEEHADRLIVVMTVNDLRLTEVQISRGLSWERTAQDVAWELAYNLRLSVLSRCAHVVISFDTAAAVIGSRRTEDGARATAMAFRLLFDPHVLEGMWQLEHPGGMIGYTSCLVAGIVRQMMISPDQPNIELGVHSGLAAMRALHLEGYGRPEAIAHQARLAFPAKLVAEELAREVRGFATADVHNPGGSGLGSSAPRVGGWWTILETEYRDSLDEVAARIVLEGIEQALEGVPLGTFGELVTVDRREIESLRSIRLLMSEYASAGRQKRPLSVAVFGAPGSGKSYGVIQVANSLLPGQVKVLEYNVSQFHEPAQLYDALHQVRDVGLSGLLPLVFWDEFDTTLAGKLGWLRHFLAPMQDGAFQQGQISHSIGRSVFVFAGGVYEKMDELGSDLPPDEFREAKAPDFVSRLKGYVNILGPNRRSEEPEDDPYFIIRRAILLRSMLLRDRPRLFDSEGDRKMLNIDLGVLRALLQTSRYKHGARSMESVIAMSQLTGKRRFERSCLPPMEQLALHVDATNFNSLVTMLVLEPAVLEKLAEAAHEVFCESLVGYKWGPKTSAVRKTHSALRPYAALPEDEKEQNRGNVRDIPAKLARAGYLMVAARSNEPPFSFPGPALEELAEMEHERWMKAKLAAGWRWEARTKKEEKAHADLLPWRKLTKKDRDQRYAPNEAAAIGDKVLPEREKKKDLDLVRGIPKILAKAGFTVLRAGDVAGTTK